MVAVVQHQQRPEALAGRSLARVGDGCGGRLKGAARHLYSSRRAIQQGLTITQYAPWPLMRLSASLVRQAPESLSKLCAPFNRAWQPAFRPDFQAFLTMPKHKFAILTKQGPLKEDARGTCVGSWEAKRVVDSLAAFRASAFEVVATCGSSWEGLPTGELGDLGDLMRRTGAGAILACSQELERDDVQRAVDAADELPVGVLLMAGLDYSPRLVEGRLAGA